MFETIDCWSLRTEDEWNETDYESDEYDVQTGGQDNNIESEESDSDSAMDQNEDSDLSVGEMYEMAESRINAVKRYGTTGYETDIRLKNLEKCKNVGDVLPRIFDDAINRILPDNQDSSMMMGATFSHPELHSPVLVPFRPRHLFNGETLISQIEKILQSNATINLEDHISKITLVSVKAPSRSGSHARHQFYSKDEILNRKCVLKIKNSDNLCLARALVVARAMIHKNDPVYQWNSIRTGDSNRHHTQRKEADKLMKKAGLKNHSGKCGIAELEKFQFAMPEYQIKVFSIEHYYACTYEGIFYLLTLYFYIHVLNLLILGPIAEKIINLCAHDEHYDVITKMPAFFSRSYFCDTCNVGYNDKSSHRCEKRCPCCYETPPCENADSKMCRDCNRYFRNSMCFENHLKKNKSGDDLVSVCDRFKRCTVCKRHLSHANRKTHKCGYFYCRTCKEEVERHGIDFNLNLFYIWQKYCFRSFMLYDKIWKCGGRSRAIC